jgi:hypothetical protein
MATLDRLKKIREAVAEARAVDEHEVVVDHGEDTEAIDALLDRGAIMGIPELVAPDAVDGRSSDHVIVSKEFHRTIYIHTYPPQVEDGWLSPLWRFEHPVDTAIYIQPLPVRPWLKRERQRLSHSDAAIRKQLEDGMNLPDPRRRAQMQESLELIDAVENDMTKPFQVLVASTVRSRNERDLDRATELLEDRLEPATTRRAMFKHKQGFETTMPLASNELAELSAVRFLHTQGVQTLFPFVNSVITHDTGALLGQSMITGEPIIINRFLQPPYGTVQSPNAAIIGATGSGKSYLAKLEMLRWLYQAVPIYVVDPTPGGEYRNVASGVGGRNIRIALDSQDHINPLDFSYAVPRPRAGQDVNQLHNALRYKLPFLTELMRVMLRADGDSTADIMDPVTQKIFTNALIECYRRYGYDVRDVRTQLDATSDKMPTLGEVHAMLDRMRRASRDTLFQTKIVPLIASMENFVGEGQYAGLFDNKSNIDMRDNLFTVFHVGDVSDRQLPIVMHMVLEFLRTTLFTAEQLESAQNRIIYVDEAQRMLSFPETAYFLGWTASTCRKYGIGLTVMTQHVGAFLFNADGSENKVGRSVLAACSLTVLLRQHPNEIDAVRQAFKLTENELIRLRQVPSGEGLIVLDQESCWFTAKYMSTDEERRFLSTTAAERASFRDDGEGDGLGLPLGSGPLQPSGDGYGVDAPARSPGLPRQDLPGLPAGEDQGGAFFRPMGS